MKATLAALLLVVSTGCLAAGEGVVSKQSRYSVAETIDRLENVLESKGVKIFARIDPAAEAEKAGLRMKPIAGAAALIDSAVQ